MKPSSVKTIDLNFQGLSDAVPVYLFPHRSGAALIECGPGSTLHNLEARLAEQGYRLEDVTDVFLTHIHLDHAGAAGALARRGATIHLHPNGAGHMLNPEKLLSSAARIYGEKMEPLWGEFLPVPEERISILPDGAEIETGGLLFKAIYSPGHANHHIAYLVDDICFAGDVGGTRMPGRRFISLPMPPPDLHIETWHETIDKLRGLHFKAIAPTHYGIYDDPEWHLDELHRCLDDVDAWLTGVMTGDPSLETLHEAYLERVAGIVEQAGLSAEENAAYEAANPTWMTPAGLYRYWKKFRSPE